MEINGVSSFLDHLGIGYFPIRSAEHSLCESINPTRGFWRTQVSVHTWLGDLENKSMLDWWRHPNLLLVWSRNWSTVGTWIIQQIQPQRLSGLNCYLLHQHFHIILLGDRHLLDSRIYGKRKRCWHRWCGEKWSWSCLSCVSRGTLVIYKD